ncbi:thiolase family protein, partial [bacterium]|nr:thiolase family protein [bacterium]
QQASVEPSEIEDIICGIVTQVGEQGFVVPRLASLVAGFPETVPGVTVNRQCGSSLTAINMAAAYIASGMRDVVVAGGCEIMSKFAIGAEWFGATLNNGQPAGMPFGPKYLERVGQLTDQGQAAEMIAEKWGISKEECDEFAYNSHQRAAKATQNGLFDREILPLEVEDGEGGKRVHKTDETIRPDTSMEKLAGLKTVFGTKMITAGNSSPISDGASAVLMMSGDKVKELGVKPLARFVGSAVTGADPVLMLTGPIRATELVLNKTGLAMDDLDVIEINEAFSPVPLAWGKEHHPDWEKVNPNGGAISLGHPVGNSGCRLTVTAIHELHRTHKRYGMITLCTGGGMAPATIIENVR